MSDHRDGPAPLALTLRNDIAVVAETLPSLRDFCRLHGVSARAANRLEVVFEELVSNVVRHGFTPGADVVFRARLEADAGVLRLTVEDDGPPFNPLARAAPAPLTDLASTPPGGLGLPLVRRLTTRFTHERPPPGEGLVNRVVVELPA